MYQPNSSATDVTQSQVCLNSEFSFASTDCLIETKGFSLSNYLIITGGEKVDSCLSQGQ